VKLFAPDTDDCIPSTATIFQTFVRSPWMKLCTLVSTIETKILMVEKISINQSINKNFIAPTTTLYSTIISFFASHKNGSLLITKGRPEGTLVPLNKSP